jgi:hypothetical protein
LVAAKKATHMPDPILVARHGDIERHLLPALANRLARAS